MTSEEVLAKLEQLSKSNYTVKEQTTFSGTSSSTAKEVYKLADNDGDTYVFRGNPDNWVTFAGKTWRIIRVNGDGTLRLLYYCGNESCDSPEDESRSAYNTDFKYNTYVGFYYGSETGDYNTTHSNAHESTIVGELKTWYQSNLETSYKEYLSETTGWCNDRTVSKAFSDYKGDGAGTNATSYAPRERFYDGSKGKTSFTPKLTCNNSDWFTIPNDKKIGNQAMTLKTTSGNYVPVGLITADEVAIGGLLYSGFSGEAEKSSYVVGPNNYWTMSPCYSDPDGWGRVFFVSYYGRLDEYGVSNTTYGVRPVINVSLDKVNNITGKGTSSERFAIT